MTQRLLFSVLAVFALFALPLAAYSQNTIAVTEAQQNEMLAYIGEYQKLQQTVSFQMKQYGIVTTNIELSKSKRNEEQKKYSENITESIKKFEAVAPPKGYEYLGKKMLAYMKTIDLSLTKTVSGFYLREAEKQLNCTNCLEAILLSYELKRKDPETNGSLIMNELDVIFEDIGTKFGFVVTTPIEERLRAQTIHDGQDYLIDLFSVASPVIVAHNDLGKIIQNLSQQKSDTSQMIAAAETYKLACKESLRMLEKLPTDFKGDKTMWQSCKTFCLAADAFATNTLPELMKSVIKKQPTDTDKKRINSAMQEFNKIAQLVKNYAVVMNTFMKKLLATM